MPTTEKERPPPARAGVAVPRRRQQVLAVAVAVLSIVAFVALYLHFVRTGSGQAMDERIRRRATHLGFGTSLREVRPVLGVISVGTLVVGVAFAIVVALLRRRPLEALAAAGVVFAANVTTELLKIGLGRPDLGVPGSPNNSFPSGHTTVATSLVAALAIVAGARLRPYVLLLGIPFAALIAVATLLSGWHRPSDLVAAGFVVLAWTCLAASVLMSIRGRASGARAGD
jgi:membrane-associated phospholipid phosphatase